MKTDVGQPRRSRRKEQNQAVEKQAVVIDYMKSKSN